MPGKPVPPRAAARKSGKRPDPSIIFSSSPHPTPRATPFHEQADPTAHLRLHLLKTPPRIAGHTAQPIRCLGAGTPPFPIR